RKTSNYLIGRAFFEPQAMRASKIDAYFRPSLSLSALSVIQVQSWRFLRVMTKTRWGANKVGRWRTFIGLSASLEVNASRNATALIGIKA
ncbi:hypothetical protein, partial [Pseudomonas syringae group genomosp. 3]|uniref:hypothetical protein n=1 Tax=Pseudomonas syringae group genomosp. 3 TaxID=251701 RepID=UPI001EE442DD